MTYREPTPEEVQAFIEDMEAGTQHAIEGMRAFGAAVGEAAVQMQSLADAIRSIDWDEPRA